MLATFREFLDLYNALSPGLQILFGVLALLVGGILIGIATVAIEDWYRAIQDDKASNAPKPEKFSGGASRIPLTLHGTEKAGRLQSGQATGLARDESLYVDAASQTRHERLAALQGGLDAIRNSTRGQS